MIAWLFPGQGTQKVGMGRALYEASPAARAVFEAADDALGEPFSRLIFEGPQDDLTQTANAQPAILTVSTAALAALREAQPNLPDPSFAAGHSLGEYSALVAAGALDLASAVRLVRLRGEAMQRAVPSGTGAMAALMGSDAPAVEALCAEVRAELGPERVVAAANFNGPGQIVIAGHAEAVALASERAGARKMKAIPLKVSAPFHCSLMEPAARAVERALEQIEVRPLRFPVISNVEAAANQDASRVAELLVRQICGSVRWQESMELLVTRGVTRAFELGPGKVLAGLARKAAPGLEICAVAEPSDLAAAGAFST